MNNKQLEEFIKNNKDFYILIDYVNQCFNGKPAHKNLNNIYSNLRKILISDLDKNILFLYINFLKGTKIILNKNLCACLSKIDYNSFYKI